MEAIQGYESSEDESDIIEAPQDVCATDKKMPDNSMRVSTSHSYSQDFLGLNSAHHSTVNTVENVTVVKSVTASNKDNVSVEIPNSSFWSDVKDMDIQKIQDKVPEKYFGKTPVEKKLKFDSDRPHGSEYHKRIKTSHGQANWNEKQLNKSKQYTVQSPQERKLFFIHSKIQPLLHSKNGFYKLPSSREWTNPGHAGATNRLKWNIPNYSHLLASCSMDSTIKLWNIWTQLDTYVQVLRVHTKAVRDIEWSADGRHILSGSYDRSSCITDAETGTAVSRFEHSSFVTCCKFHPVNPHVSITGSNNQLQAWDHRTPDKPCKIFKYKDNFGQVQDLVITGDGSTVFSCSDLLSRDSADRNIMAWDYNTAIVLSNQIYQDVYNVNRLTVHPTEPQLLAQSTGNYIAIFSLQRPYKMHKHKTFDKHKSQEYNIGMDVSPNGQIVYSGSDDGKVYCYNYMSGKLIRTIDTSLSVAMDIACHPLLPSTLAVSSWDGTLQVWK